MRLFLQTVRIACGICFWFFIFMAIVYSPFVTLTRPGHPPHHEPVGRQLVAAVICGAFAALLLFAWTQIGRILRQPKPEPRGFPVNADNKDTTNKDANESPR